MESVNYDCLGLILIIFVTLLWLNYIDGCNNDFLQSQYAYGIKTLQ